MRRSRPPRTPVERSLLEVEGYLRDFADDNEHIRVSVLRFCNVLGPDIRTPLRSALELPLVPSILGYDPSFQFIHEQDVVRSMLYVIDQDLSGAYNLAGDGRLPWSEIVRICGKRMAPMPPIRVGAAARALRLTGLVDLPPETLDLLRHGRGVDNRKLRREGFQYEFTTAGTV